MKQYVIKRCSLIDGVITRTLDEADRRFPWDVMAVIDEMLSRTEPGQMVVVYQQETEEES